MNRFYDESKYDEKRDSITSSENSNTDDTTIYEGQNEEKEELLCRNMDPVLAKLMGITIEEQKEIDWKPPEKSGLDNSERIIPNDEIRDFNNIKNTILDYKSLSEKQIDYIKYLNNEETIELIKTYDKVLKEIRNSIKHTLKFL
jgi:hypothetical protein